MKSVLIILLTCICYSVYAQVVQDPLADMINQDKKSGADYPYFPGRVYLKWVLDINHDGNHEILLADKPTKQEREMDDTDKVVIAYQPDQYGFDVYLPLTNGKYLSLSGVNVDVSQCYVGYIKELKRYGIVTLQNYVKDDPDAPEAKHGVLKHQIVAYTIHRHKLIETDLTPIVDPNEKNAIYSEYLTDKKTTDVHIEEITASPPK